MQSATHTKLNNAQLNLIRSFKYLHNEKKINEIDSLINFYLEQKLDAAIARVESENNYNAAIYEQWLKEEKAKDDR
jgi:hypothetical protein